MISRCACRVSLPVAIVDTLQDDDVEYGEVLVYELTSDFLRNQPSTRCYIATLRFTDFTGNHCRHNYDNIDIFLLCRRCRVGCQSGQAVRSK